MRAALRDESGFSLVELLTACLIGVVILFAAMSLMDFATKSTARTGQRVEGVANGRLVMEQMTRQLRSQLCPGTNTGGVEDPAIITAEADKIVFYGSLAPAPGTTTTESGRLTLQRRTLEFVTTSGNRGNLVERVETKTNPTAPVTTPPTWSAPVVRTLAANVARASAGAPIFKYFKYDAPNSPSMSPIAAPITDRNQRSIVVRIDIAFDTYPTGGTEDKLRTVFEDQAFVRTADPTDPEHSPKCL